MVFCKGIFVLNSSLNNLQSFLKYHTEELFLTDTSVTGISKDICSWLRLRKLHLMENKHISCENITSLNCERPFGIFGQCEITDHTTSGANITSRESVKISSTTCRGTTMSRLAINETSTTGLYPTETSA